MNTNALNLHYGDWPAGTAKGVLNYFLCRRFCSCLSKSSGKNKHASSSLYLFFSSVIFIYRGRFSVAKRCDQRGSKRTVAAKHVNKKLLRREQVLQEIRLLQTLDHPNLVRLLDTYETANSFVLVLEM